MQAAKRGYSRVPRLSDTRYLANGTKGKWRYASSDQREMEICKQQVTKGKWRYASSKAVNRDMQVAKRD